MARQATSARGERVDFDILAIKQALASQPIGVSTEERRQFIDTKNGIKPKVIKEPAPNGLVDIAPVTEIPDAMALAMEAVTLAQQVFIDEPAVDKEPVKAVSKK